MSTTRKLMILVVVIALGLAVEKHLRRAGPAPSMLTVTSGVVSTGDLPSAYIGPPLGGTVIQATAELGNVATQDAIVAAFAKLDPKVPARSVHFAWVPAYVRPVGWQGRITGIKQYGEDWFVDLDVWPLFATSTTIVKGAECKERWVYDGTLTQVPRPHTHDPRGIDSLIVN